MKIHQLFLALVAACLLVVGSPVFANDDDGTEQAQIETMQVNVNTADAETIASVLSGVGLARAEAIVTYREKYGRFYSAEELTSVRGVGKTTIEKNQSRISVE